MEDARARRHRIDTPARVPRELLGQTREGGGVTMGYELDLFIDHAAADAAFVRGFLLPHLGLPEDRVGLSSELRPGRVKVAELERLVESARWIVLVLSAAHPQSRWNRHTARIATHESVGKDRLVPLLLGSCRRSLSLRALVELDFRDQATWEVGAEKLRRTIRAAEAPAREIPCPYPGMRPFKEDEQAHFHGRDRERQELLQHLHVGQREILVVGPSGSGKSSLLAAGVLPEVRKGTAVRVLRPGPRPRQRLLETLEPGEDSAPTERFVLFVDQLEELFVQSDPAERREFVDVIRRLRGFQGVSILYSLRADFYGALMSSELWPSDRRICQVDIPPLRGDKLREAIERPARDVDVHFDGRLVDQLMNDAAEEPGALPLLQDMLLQLWSRRLRSYVPLSAYDELGVADRSGLAVMLARRADAALSELSPHQEKLAANLFLRLVSFGEGRPDTRRSRSATDLGASGRRGGHAAVILEHLVERRLLTADRRPPGNEVWYDIAHEALISAWPRLREWIEAGRADEQRRDHLERRAVEWREGRSGPLDEIELREAEAWLTRQAAHGVHPSAALSSLLERSRSAAAELARLRDESDRRNREYRRIVALGFLDRGRQLLLQGRPLRALPCFVAAREAGLDSPSLRLLFARALHQRGTVSIPHDGAVTAACFTPDGLRVITASVDRAARMWNAETGEPVGPALRHEQSVAAAAPSPDGARIATSGHDHAARLWDASDGRPIGSLRGHAGPVTSILWSPDGSRLLTTSQDRTARIWDAARGLLLCPPLEHDGFVIAAAFAPDGRRVATASADRTGRVWDAETGAPITPPLEHLDMVRAVLFHPDGERVLTGSEDRTARLWSARTGELLTVLDGHTRGVRAAAFSPHGSLVVTASEDRTARIWDGGSGRPMHRPLEHQSTVRAVSFSADGAWLVTASDDGTCRLWDGHTGDPICAPLEHPGAVTAAAFSPDRSRVVTACRDGAARVWRAATEELPGPRLEHKRFVRAAAFSPDGERVVTVSDDGTACLWRSSDGHRLRRLHDHTGSLLACAFSPDGELVATTGDDRTARLWRVESGRPARGPLRHGGKVTSVRFSPDGARVVTASSDRIARVWDVASGRALVAVEHGREVLGASFDPAGERIVTASDDRTARVWDAASGEPRAAPLEHRGPVWMASFSPDGARVLTASGDGTARLWDARTGARLHALEHAEAVRIAVFSPDGARVLTASDDKTARVWSAQDGEPLTPPLEHQGALTAAAFRPDGALIVTASWDMTARVWDVASGQPLLPPLAHGKVVVAASFSPEGTRILTASLDRTARIWVLPTHQGTLDEWRALSDEHSPVVLANGVLMPRRGFRVPESTPPPSPTAPRPARERRRRARTGLRPAIGNDPR